MDQERDVGRGRLSGETFALDEETQDCWPGRNVSGRVLPDYSWSVRPGDVEVMEKDDETTDGALFSLPRIQIISQQLVLSSLSEEFPFAA